jgi:hypothetical protein
MTDACHGPYKPEAPAKEHQVPASIPGVRMFPCTRLFATGHGAAPSYIHWSAQWTLRYALSIVPIWYVANAATYANTVMYVNVKIGQNQLLVSRLITAIVAAH